MNGDLSLLSLVVRMSIAMVLVLGLLYGLSHFAQRRNIAGMGRRATGRGVEVLSRHPLTKSAAVALVRVGDKAVLLGVTESSVELLLDDAIDLDEEDHDEFHAGGRDDQNAGPRTADAAETSVSTSPWMSLIDALREKTVRRA